MFFRCGWFFPSFYHYLHLQRAKSLRSYNENQVHQFAMNRSEVLYHQRYFTINGFWVGLSNCFLFVLLNSQNIFEMVMPVQHGAKVYKSIWDVCTVPACVCAENMFFRLWLRIHCVRPALSPGMCKFEYIKRENAGRTERVDLFLPCIRLTLRN